MSDWRIVAAAACMVVALLASSALAADELTFEKHVRPIFKAHCFQCHGEEERESNLDVRQVRLMSKGGESGPAIVAGDAAGSYLVQRLEAGEMPPEGEGKRISAEQLATIRRWIDQGAKTARPEAETLADVTEAEKEFWSFRPIGGFQVLEVRGAASLRSPIDAFLLAELEKKGLGFSPEASRATLIRRAYFDLTGLPPPPDEVERFSTDQSPDSWERLVDRLLAMPQYGERWGRHWLDVAGYADSDGYTERDPVRKYAFKYRDYVIRALNADKPWDAFLQEQLAGDELLTPPYTNLSSQQADRLAATGLLRMAPDGTGTSGVDPSAARNDVIAETIKIVSTSVLGLTVGCAQCHNHRYDPIPQADYYRWRAIFEPAYDTKNWRTPEKRLVSLWSDEVRDQAAAVDAELKKLAEERDAEMDKIVADIFEAEVAKLPEDQREPARQAKAAEASKRTFDQKQILKYYPSLNVSRGSAYLYEKKRVDQVTKSFEERTKEVSARRPAEDFVPCLTEVPGQLPQTAVFFRGDINQPKETVEPGELLVLESNAAKVPVDDPSVPTSGRRLAYARWLTSGEHPLVGRVLVNRFWMHHFGRGIVSTPADFGYLGERPSHPVLLDWMAARFSEGGWELKRLHRMLMASAAYRQESHRTDALDAVDSDNRLLGRMSIRRLEAEAVRDSILAASGQLNSNMLGPPVPVTVDEVGQVIVGLDNRDSAGRPQGKRGLLGAGEFRRSVYVQVRRSQPLSMLETFDAPALNPNCEIRNRSTVAPQSLLLMNNEFVLSQAQVLAERAAQEAGDDAAAQVRLVWRLALSHEPNEEELSAAIAFVAEQKNEFVATPANAKTPPPPPEVRALASLCQALFSSNAFLYVD
jgi:mono/diheme cytochrome c family protein